MTHWSWSKSCIGSQLLSDKYTNPAKGILDFCKQKLTAPPMAMFIQSIVPLSNSKCWIVWILNSERERQEHETCMNLKGPPYGRGLIVICGLGAIELQGTLVSDLLQSHFALFQCPPWDLNKSASSPCFAVDNLPWKFNHNTLPHPRKIPGFQKICFVRLPVYLTINLQVAKSLLFCCSPTVHV